VPISPSVPATRGRFRPGVWPTLAAIALVAATTSLGNWQARRAALRETLQQQAETMSNAAPIDIVRASDVKLADRYRRARAGGEYDAARQIWLDNRTHNGTAGFQVLTPLRLDDGSVLLIARGWVARSATLPTAAPPAAPVPTGRVVVEGRLNLPPSRFLELKHVEPRGGVWQNLDLDEFAKASGLVVAPLVLEQEVGTSDGLLRDWPPPDLGRDKNVSYMWQWYAFAALTVVFWIILGWRRRE